MIFKSILCIKTVRSQNIAKNNLRLKKEVKTKVVWETPVGRITFSKHKTLKG